MRSKLAIALTAVLSLIVAPTIANAQRGGGGHGGGGGHSGGGHGGGAAHVGGGHMSAGAYHGGYHGSPSGAHYASNYNGGYHGTPYHGGSYNHGGYYGHNGYYHNGHYGYYYPGIAFGIGLGLGYYGGSGYYYGGSPYYSDTAASYYYAQPAVTTAPVDQSYQAPPPIQIAADEARVMVHVPSEAAEVWFNGALTTTQGLHREYRTAQLEPGKKYSYNIRVRWQDGNKVIDRTRDVPIMAGRGSEIDFAQPEALNPPPAAKP